MTASPNNCKAFRLEKLADKQILVVDDEDDVRDLIRIALERGQAKVRDVASVDAALDALGDDHFDLIISSACRCSTGTTSSRP